MSVEAPLEFVTPREPKPAWLKVRAPGSENYLRLKGIMKDLRLNTVCAGGDGIGAIFEGVARMVEGPEATLA